MEVRWKMAALSAEYYNCTRRVTLTISLLLNNRYVNGKTIVIQNNI